MEMTTLYQKIEQYLCLHADEIVRIGEAVLDTPELGYREEKTSAYVRKTLRKLGIDYTYPHALTGVKATLKGRKSLFNVCIIGEMDAVKCAGHAHEGDLSAAHACGHHAQIAAMLGSAIVLKNSGIMEELDGDVTLMAVPAEEFIELGYRNELKKKGKINHFGGKQQLILEGAFDDVDVAMMIHAQGDEPNARLYVRGTNLGFVAQTITFTGKAVHGSTPYDGVNALNAAALSILGIHANRETFREEEKIRIHPIVTKGGDVVNSVPDEVCVETYVRGATLDAIKKGSAVVERAVDGACRMIGANYKIDSIPGYLPLTESRALSEVLEAVSESVLGKDQIVYGEPITGSSDIGDLSHLIPTVQPSIGGFSGALHSREFTASDPSAAYLKATEILVKTTAELLYDNAKKAAHVKATFQPKLTKAEYIKYLNERE
ncbi:MAG: amidohydrolase [Clostridia bacterium]|nr:amidohydrolase [Clostridia bacterium]